MKLSFKILLYPSFYRELWYDYVSTVLKPRNRWYYSSIPRQFRDIDTILEESVLKCVINIVEQQKIFEVVDLQASGEKHKLFELELRKYYNLIKYEIPEIENQIKKEWDKISNKNTGKNLNEIIKDLLEDFNPTDKNNYEQKYGNINSLEVLLHQKKTEAMVWICENRSYMWT